MSAYCTECGTQLIDGVCPKCTSKKGDNKYDKIFVDSKEKFITVLGSGYAQNFLLRGSISKGFAIVSNRRAYFKGTTYEIRNLSGKKKKKYSKTRQSRVVDLNDITGTGYDTIEDEFCKWARFISLIPIVIVRLSMFATPYIGGRAYAVSILIFGALSIFFHWKYIQSKISLITIQYAGGEIAFDINWFSKEEIDDFQKQLRIAKDRVHAFSENAMANTIQEAMRGAVNHSSAADELAKYATLFEKGLISREEFEHFKRKLL